MISVAKFDGREQQPPMPPCACGNCLYSSLARCSSFHDDHSNADVLAAHEFIRRMTQLYSSSPSWSTTDALMPVVEVIPLVAGTAPIVVGRGVVGA
eukprot:1384529-Rhodomonas_salina.1